MSDIEFEKELQVHETGIEGLKVVDLAVHGDSRGWFKENWQRAKMCALGIPDLHVVQNNISFNANKGVTRGIHAEPWDKFISLGSGRILGAWVDLRDGSPTYDRSYRREMDMGTAVYVPRGVGNGFRALEDSTVYTYLVDTHWSAELKETYTFVNLADPELTIEWPISLSEATLSEADKRHPYLKDVVPMARSARSSRAATASWAAPSGASPRASSRPSTGTASTSPGGTPPRRPPRRSTRPRGINPCVIGIQGD